MAAGEEFTAPSPTDVDGVEHALDSPTAGRKAIRGAGLRALSYGAGGLLAAISAPLLIRHLGLVGFGHYTTVYALVTLVGGLTEAGLGPVGVREYTVLEGSARDRLMRNLLGLRMALTLAAICTATAFAAVAGYEAPLVIGTFIAGSALLLEAIQATVAIPLYATLRIGRQVVAEQLRQAGNVVLIVLLVVLGASVLPFLAVPLPTGLGLLAITIYFVRGSFPLRPAFELSQWRGVLRQTLPVALSGAVHTLYLRSVIITMSLLAGAVQTGLFSTSYRLIEVLVGLPILLIGTLFPILARAAETDQVRLRYGVQRMFDISIMAGLGLAVATALGAPTAIEVLAGPSGRGAVPVLQIHAASLCLAFLSSTFGFALLSLRRHRQLAVASGAAFVVTIGLALGLVGSIGARGGAIASVAGEMVLVLALGAQMLRVRPDLRPASGVALRASAAATAAAGAALLLPVAPAGRVALFLVVYSVLLACLRTIPRELAEVLEEPRARLAGRLRPRG